MTLWVQEKAPCSNYQLEAEMSSYKGLYTQSVSGRIFNVQVAVPGGHSIALSPEMYVERGILPPIDQLPDIAQYHAAKNKPG